MTTHLDIDLVPLLDELFDVLMREPNPVRQQQTLELLIVKQAMRMGSTKDALIVADGIHKHVTQLIKQLRRERAAR